MNTTDIESLLKTFPRRKTVAALSGAHIKYSVEKVDGKFRIPEATDEEHRASFQFCESSAQELLQYSLRKAREFPKWTNQFNFDRTRAGLAEKARDRQDGWDLEPDEVEWVLNRLKGLLVASGWTDLAD